LLEKDYYGTKRLKSPEENKLNEIINEKTPLFTLGTIIFDMFSDTTNIEERYNKGCFIPNIMKILN
jgi:serine/threonine-protein kinase